MCFAGVWLGIADMTTEQLINLLVMDLKPVSRSRISRALTVALVTGAAAAFGAMLLVFGSHLAPLSGRNLSSLSTKIVFAVSVIATATVFLPRLARPGVPMRTLPKFLLVPFAAIVTSAAVALASRDYSAWPDMMLAADSVTCVVSIPLLPAMPLAFVIWALRMGAPTDSAHAGEAAGLVAGGLAALACAFPCVDEALPAIALWYGLPIAVCAAVGAKLGPRLLRW